MCGINGIISRKNFESPDDTRSKLDRMNNIIVHRGPDAGGIFLRDSTAFGFRRLSIIDLTDQANQPMLSDDGEVVIIFNGEIYNYIELRDELIANGYSFRTKSDTEVILVSYMAYGDKCVEKFNGMWAFAIYDFRSKQLFCSRDRLGVKPFYYCLENNTLFFSSELKSLHSVCSLRKANHAKVYEYLAYGYRVNDGETFLENCFELLPGTNLHYSANGIELKKYWTLSANQYKHNEKLNYYEEYIQLFESAVKLRYRSDVPVALLLSGGLDSSAIAKVTDNLIERKELGQNDVHAFIASFPDFKDDETAIAREFIKTCKHIKLHEIEIDTKNVIDELENTIYGFDHPLASFTSIVHNIIMKECKKRGIKVVLNGQGSDEAYAGYDRYNSGAYLLDQILTKKGNFFSEIKYLNKKNKFSYKYLFSQMFKSVLSPSYSSYLRAKYQEKSLSSLKNSFVELNRKHYQPQYKFSVKGNNFSKYLLNQINHQGLNHILHYEDVSSMNQSIEIRSPFMDYRLMEFAFSIPTELKFSKGVTKVIQRETIGKMLPDSIVSNRQKIGFRTPFTEYITNDEKFKSFIAGILNSDHFRKKKIWKPEQIKKVFDNPSKNPNFPFWRIINLEIWSKVYNIENL